MLRRVFDCLFGALQCLAIVFFCANAAIAATGTATVGTDLWEVPNQTARYLPNYSLPSGHGWQKLSKWARATVQDQFETDFGPVLLTAQGRYSTLLGMRVDRLDADIRVSDDVGLRLGVLPYRIAWCRTYDNTSPWMSEPDAFCRFHGLNEMAQGSFGLQAYHSDFVGKWVVDSMVGIYRPEVDGQSKGLGPYVAVGPTTHHKKMGASINALNLASGIQARAAWLNTQQNQKSDAGSYERYLDYDTYYFAVEGNATPTLNLRGSLSAYIGTQGNPALPYKWDGRSTTFEAIYKPVHGQSIALGLSEYTNITTYAKPPHNQRLDVPSLSLAWRSEWGDGLHTVVQASRTKDDAMPRSGVSTHRTGNALGVRLGKSF